MVPIDFNWIMITRSSVAVEMLVSLTRGASQPRDTIYLWTGKVPSEPEAKLPLIQTDVMGENMTRLTKKTDLCIIYYALESELKVIGKNNSPKNIYIHHIKLNSEELDRFRSTHEEIPNGGTLELEMGSEAKI